MCYQRMKKWWSYVDDDPWLGGLVLLSTSEGLNLMVLSDILHYEFHLYFIEWTKPLGYGIYVGLLLFNYLILVRGGRLRRIMAEFEADPQELTKRNTLLFYAYLVLTITLLVLVPLATSNSSTG